MAHTQHTIVAADLAAITVDPQRGVISLVGDHGGLSLVTGEVTESNIIMGTMPVETEHGTLYLDLEAEIRISEDNGSNLNTHQDGSLYAINDVLTAHLAERFDWVAADDAAYDELNEATHATAQALDDLLTRFPAGRTGEERKDAS